MKKYNYNKKGISLVETIIYLAIFTIVSILVINSFVTVMSSFVTTRTNRDILESGINSLERISREVRQAKSIDVVNSDFTNGILQLNSTDSVGNPTVIKFSKNGDQLDAYKDGSLVGNLLNQDIIINSLIFRRISTSQSEAVKIEMTLQDTRGKNHKMKNFYDTVILRGEY